MKKQPLSHAPAVESGSSNQTMPKELRRQASVETGAGDAAHNQLIPRSRLLLRRLLTIAEVCEATGFSESTIRRAVRLRHLAVIKMNRSVRLSQEDVDTWLKRNRWNSR
jgi:excisionase family DNA binding protein